MLTRILVFIALIVSVMALPWWTAFLVGLVGIGTFPRYYEVIPAALWFDLSYGLPEATWSSFQGTIIAIGLLFIVEAIRRAVIFYR